MLFPVFIPYISVLHAWNCIQTSLQVKKKKKRGRQQNKKKKKLLYLTKLTEINGLLCTIFFLVCHGIFYLAIIVFNHVKIRIQNGMNNSFTIEARSFKVPSVASINEW